MESHEAGAGGVVKILRKVGVPTFLNLFCRIGFCKEA